MNVAFFFRTAAICLGVWLTLAVFGTAFAQAQMARPEAERLLQQADKAYEGNHFEEALPAYQKLLEDGRLTSARMLSRMALIEETRGRLPETLYYLNLLYTLHPDAGVRTRMESLARQYQLDGYDMDEWDFFRKLLRRFWMHLFAAFAFIIACLVGILYYRRWRGRPLRLLPLAVLLMLVLASLALNLNVRYGKAIVVGGKAALMDEASAASNLEGFVPPGTRLTVIGEEDAWMRVVYKDKQGFVPRSMVWYF